MEPATLTNLLGLGLGLLYGFIANRSGFCFLAGVRALAAHESNRQLRSFTLAMMSALALTQLLVAYAGLDNLDESVYLAAAPNLVVIVIGAAIFSLGMVLANGCPNRHLVLLGEGNLRSLMVLLVLGISAYMTFKGLFALPRMDLGEATALDIGVRDLPQALELLGLPAARLVAVIAILLLLGVFLFCSGWFKPHNLAKSWDGLIIGACIASAWYITGVLGIDEFDPQPPESLTFTVPMGEALLYLMTFTGSTLGFMTSVIGGVLVGSLGNALLSGRFELRAFDNGSGQMLRMLFGALLMGIGGVMALGCTIGQGLSGLGALSIGSLVAMATFYLFTYWLLRRLGK